MSNSQAVFKVADQIRARLFDHKQFTSGQIDYLVRGLDNGSSGQEDPNLNSILRTNESICLLADRLNSGRLTATDQPWTGYSGKISDALVRGQELIKLESEYKKKESELLARNRSARDRKLQDYERVLIQKLETLKANLDREEIELEKKYLKLEENLMKTTYDD